MLVVCAGILVSRTSIADEPDDAVKRLLAGDIAWAASPPLVAPANRPDDPCFSVKDPTVVWHDGRWHLFCTIRSEKRTHQVEYLSFAKWEDANAAERHVLKISEGYFCAPQVFYFTPHRKWYMVLQVTDESRKVALQPAVSTNDDVSDPAGWSKPALLFEKGHPENVSMWIDFWVICDAEHAHLFFTSLDGRMWRSQTPLDKFPRGWDEPRVVLEGEIFEASHTYRLKGLDQFLTVVEAQRPGGRYYKAYLADGLAGPWRPLADSLDKPFAGLANTTMANGDRWFDSISHGELLRDGSDEQLVVDPARLRFLFQGVRDADYAGNAYGRIPWRLGLLEAAPLAPPREQPRPASVD